MGGLFHTFQKKQIMYHIFHSTTTHFSIADRLRILFGRTVSIEVKIQTTDENIGVISTKTDIWVDRRFTKPVKNGRLDNQCDGNCGMNYCDESGRTQANPTTEVGLGTS